MHEITGTVLAVSPSNTKNGRSKWDVAFSDGVKYTSWDGGLASQAQALLNQQAVAQVDVTQNGQYTNYTLRAIRPASGAPVRSAPLPLAPATSPPSRGGRDPEVEARIVRQSSMATAFKFVGALYTGAGPEALEEAREKAVELAKHLFSHAFGNKQAQAETVPTAPAEVAAQVNEVLGGAVKVGAGTPDW